LFSIRVSAHLDAERLADQLLEGRQMTRRGPQLELGVAGGSQLQQCILAPIVIVEAGD
jgi:hypothetical protein